jgi:hypothetical protein
VELRNVKKVSTVHCLVKKSLLLPLTGLSKEKTKNFAFLQSCGLCYPKTFVLLTKAAGSRRSKRENDFQHLVKQKPKEQKPKERRL